MYVGMFHKGNSPDCMAIGGSGGPVDTSVGVWEVERSCILVLLLPSEGEAAELWLPLRRED